MRDLGCKEMNCSEVQRLLSSYFDNELTTEVRGDVEKHVQECSSCAEDLARYERLSNVAGNIETPLAPSSRIWEQLSENLGLEDQAEIAADSYSERPSLSPREDAGRKSRYVPIGWLAAIAAMLLIGVSVFSFGTWFEKDGHNHDMSALFGQYLEKFRHDPLAAQTYLLASYENHNVDVSKAGELLGYQPAITGGVPEGYAVESIHVLKMPCCTCVQCLCKRENGTSFAIFEHNEDSAKEWFGGSQAKPMVCEGVPCTLIDVGNNQLAGNWINGQRRITIVGLQDSGELNQLVSWFESRRRVQDEQGREIPIIDSGAATSSSS